MSKTIIISGYFSDEAAEKKLRYFERLDAALRELNHKLLLFNVAMLPPTTTCECLTIPRYSRSGTLREREVLNLEDLSIEMLHAAMVEAEATQTKLVPAAVRILLLSSYFTKVIQEKNPVLWVMWHKFNGHHQTLTHVCRKLDQPYLYIEYGVLPGTVNFDPIGQMAESWVTQRNKEFLALPFDKADLKTAEKYLDHVRRLKKCRKPQDSGVDIRPIIEKAHKRGRKIVFYAGQNDWASGILPRALPESKVHSQVYDDTIDALQHLSEVAEKLDCQILFKPHPLVEDRHRDVYLPYPDRVDFVLGANIFECMEMSDVTTTIVSQVCYLALVHNRPCLLLGRNQLRGKGCTNQVSRRDELEKWLAKSMEDGFHGKARKRWRKHVAQLCRYYLFSFEKDVAVMIGRDVDTAARYLVNEATRQNDGDKNEFAQAGTAETSAVKLSVGSKIKNAIKAGLSRFKRA